MERVFYIQNMVCDRCKSMITQIIHENKARIKELQLGKISILTDANFQEEKFAEELAKEGFELIKNPDIQTVESIKVLLVNLVDSGEFPQSLSDFIAGNLNKDYSYLSKLFRKISGETLEKYFIRLKIEKVKEFIQMQKYSFSEIAYKLDYNSISHLSGQFKSVTGMTMSQYQENQDWNRIPLDKIL